MFALLGLGGGGGEEEETDDLDGGDSGSDASGAHGAAAATPVEGTPFSMAPSASMLMLPTPARNLRSGSHRGVSSASSSSRQTPDRTASCAMQRRPDTSDC